MLVVFLMLVTGLLILYFMGIRKENVEEEFRKDKTSAFITTCILAALTVEGILSIHEENAIQDYSLEELEQFVLNEKGVTFEEWAEICYEAVPESSLTLDFDAFL